MLTRRNEIFILVKEIDEVLNPNKPEYDPTKTEEEFLSSLGITQAQYYWALSISVDSDFDCTLINAGLKGFSTNVDLQPVFNHYKCV